MKNSILACIFTTIALISTSIFADSADYRQGELLIQFADSTNKDKRNSIQKSVNATTKQQFSSLNIEHWQLPDKASVEDTVAKLNARDDVIFAEPNYLRKPLLLPNDTDFGEQWAMQNTGQTLDDPDEDEPVTGTAGADMDVTTAWDTTTGSREVVIAVVDIGVQINHDDLNANIWINAAEAGGTAGIDDDGNGFIDDINGWDFVSSDNDPSPNNSSENHGTLVAGTLGAVGNNALGVAGVNWQVSIMPLKFELDVASELAALTYAAKNGAHIVNASYGGLRLSVAESQAVDLLEANGILLVAAAGNFGSKNDIIPFYPANLENPNVLTVAASDPDDRLTDWTHHGNVTVDLAAPGINIYTTDFNNTFNFTAGTSFSSPYVAGIAGLVKAQFPTANFWEMKARILGSVDSLSQTGLTATDGRANAANALSIAAQPIIVIHDITLNDSNGNNNGLLDAGESVELNIELENLWQTATSVNATLSTTDSLINLTTNNATYADLAQGDSANSTSAFALTLSATATAHRRIPFSVTITADGGFQVTRNFNIQIGQLFDDVEVSDVIQQHDQDDLHLYHIEVPIGTKSVVFTTTSEEDIDIMVKLESHPRLLGNFIADGGTLFSAGLEGDETINLTSPPPGTYFVVISNFSQEENTAYTVKAKFNADILDEDATDAEIPIGDVLDCDPFGSCVITLDKKGGGSLSWLEWFFVLAIILFTARNRQARKN